MCEWILDSEEKSMEGFNKLLTGGSGDLPTVLGAREGFRDFMYAAMVCLYIPGVSRNPPQFRFDNLQQGNRGKQDAKETT